MLLSKYFDRLHNCFVYDFFPFTNMKSFTCTQRTVYLNCQLNSIILSLPYNLSIHSLLSDTSLGGPPLIELNTLCGPSTLPLDLTLRSLSTILSKETFNFFSYELKKDLYNNLLVNMFIYPSNIIICHTSS